MINEERADYCLKWSGRVRSWSSIRYLLGGIE